MAAKPAISNIQLIQELMSKDIADKGGKFASDPLQKQKNTFNAVTDLLTGLLDQEAVNLIRSATKSNGSVSLDSKYAGVGLKGNNQVFPSFNVRTPIVEVVLNGIPLYPNKLDLDTGQEVKNAKLNFETFNLTMPMGGVEKTITGNITFFTKNPEEILAYLNVGLNGTSNSTDFSTSGLPTISLKFGWAFSDSASLSKVSKAISPKLNFLVTNISMTDPGVGGTTFTLSLQELGTVILEHSSDDLLFDPDYPQQQLRTLLEGLLHVRLFTLDDLLYLGETNGVNPVQAGSSGNSTVVTKIQSSIVKDPNTTGAVSSTKSDSVNTIQQTKTFFLTQPGPSFGVNGKNFFTIASELAAHSRCLWYPHNNGDDAKNAAMESQKAITSLTSLAQDLKMIKSLPSDIVTLSERDASNIRKSIQNIGDNSNKSNASHLTKTEAENLLETGLKKSMARVATRCTLFWVPNVPADWNTTGSNYYSSGANREHKAIPYDEGAFFLLPDVLDDYDIFVQDLPVQYGPGASNLPYFYGSGQNVFQVSLGKDKQPKLFGEVLNIAVTHNNLIVALANSADESLAYAVNGQRLGQLEAAINFTNVNDISKHEILPLTDAEQAAATFRANEKGNKILNDAYGAQSALVKNFKANRRLKHSLALGANGSLLILDGDNLEGKDRSISPPEIPGKSLTGPAQSASYHIKSRVATFLRYPTQARITILGDPNLLRLGPGCFELFSYYPVEHKDGTITQELNALTSGIYFVEKIEHTINGSDFITALSGSKIVDPFNVPSSVTNKIFNKLKEKTIKKDPKNVINDNINNDILHEFQSVNLNSPNFTSGILGQELKNIFTTYINSSTLPK